MFVAAIAYRCSSRRIRVYTTGLRPDIKLIRSTTIAMTSKMWMYPPKVYELTNPSNHKTSRITKIVQSMSSHLKSGVRQTGHATLIQIMVEELFTANAGTR